MLKIYIKLKLSHMHFFRYMLRKIPRIRLVCQNLPSLQNFPWFMGSCRKENFCKSAYVSVRSPTINIPLPVLSSGVIVRGALGWECLGELIIMTGNDTTNTQTAYVCMNIKNSAEDMWNLYLYLERPKYGKSYDISLCILKLLISSDLNNTIEKICW